VKKPLYRIRLWEENKKAIEAINRTSGFANTLTVLANIAIKHGLPKLKRRFKP